jgi:hypothetical protein
MFVAARGAILEDRDFVDFLGHCWRYSELDTQIMTEVIAKCGYGLCFVQPEPVPVDTPLLLEYDGSTTNTNTEVEPPITMDDFIQTCNTYGTYMALDQLDNIIDIARRCNPHHDDPEDLNQALQEIIRLAQEAIVWGEMTTEDNDEEPSDEDGLFDYDRDGEDDNDR